MNSHGSCEAYETAPLTVIDPDSGGSSPRMAWNKLDLPEPTVPITAIEVEMEKKSIKITIASDLFF